MLETHGSKPARHREPSQAPDKKQPRRSTAPALAVYTVGYAGRTVSDLITTLQASGIRRLVDVRALPLSRRRGFSKTALSAALALAGIEYVHMREAGNPFRHEAADVERCLSLYRAHLGRRPEVVDELARVVGETPSALLCVEADPACCHRSVLASCIEGLHRAATVTNL